MITVIIIIIIIIIIMTISIRIMIIIWYDFGGGAEFSNVPLFSNYHDLIWILMNKSILLLSDLRENPNFPEVHRNLRFPDQRILEYDCKAITIVTDHEFIIISILFQCRF